MSEAAEPTSEPAIAPAGSHVEAAPRAGAMAPDAAAALMQRAVEVAQGPAQDERQAASRKVGESARLAIDRLTCTTAPPEVLIEVEAKMAEIIGLLEGHGSARQYLGSAEASGLGRDRGFFDWSPQMGRANPLAPPIHASIQDGMVVGTVRFGAAYEGPPGCVHGGFVAAAFDEILGLAQSLSGQVGMTASLSVRYRRPTPLHTELRLEARLDGVSGRKVTSSGVMMADGDVTAEATGLFVTVSPERFESLIVNRPS